MDLVAEAEASAAVAEAVLEEVTADPAVLITAPIITALTDPEVLISAADGSTVHITDEDITEAVASVDLSAYFSCPSSLFFLR